MNVKERKKSIIFQDVDHKKDDDEASPGFSKDYNWKLQYILFGLKTIFEINKKVYS